MFAVPLAGANMTNPRIKATGKVKWYDARKGYGFAELRGGSEVFLHYGALATNIVELKAGQEIQFHLERTAQGEVAHRVRIVEA
jgi:cold shock protein